MKTAQLTSWWIPVALVCALPAPIHAALIVNGGFESGFVGWTKLDQLGSESTFLLQTGTTSPLNAFAVPAPPGGTTAAMTDAFGPGSHVLYQDFVVTGGLTSYSLEFSLFVNNDNGAPNFFTPSTLDFATPALNQRARVDIIKTSADPFSLAAGDVLQTLFETTPGGPLVFGYTSFAFDVTALMQANQGTTLRLRFAEVDNVAPFNLGIDNVNVQIGGTASVPDVLPWLTPWIALLGVTAAGTIHRQRSRLRSLSGA